MRRKWDETRNCRSITYVRYVRDHKFLREKVEDVEDASMPRYNAMNTYGEWIKLRALLRMALG
jgi:hypothetical protein